MTRWLKPGPSAGLKTRSIAKRAFGGVVLVTWLLSVLACSSGYIGSTELTETAAVLPTSAPTILPPTSAPSETAGPLASVPTDTPESVAGSGATPDYTATPPRPTQTPTHTPTPGPSPTPLPPILYQTMAGDTLPSLAVRFGVAPEEITSPDPIPPEGYISPNQLLIIPARLDMENTSPQQLIMPDSEVVFSPSAVDFDINAYVNKAGGYLSTYREWMSMGWLSGADVVKRVAVENSVNPRLLLALLEFQGHWIYGQPRSLAERDYPLGYVDFSRKDLYKQLSWAVEQLSIGYYGWQNGHITELEFSDGTLVRLWPELNCGTVAIAYFFSRIYNANDWANLLSSPDIGFLALHQKMYGNPWLRAQSVEPLFPPDLTQPDLNLPYAAGESWAFSGGPHPAWGPNGALAALDFAPPSMKPGCVESNLWVTAAATGLVVRTSPGVVVLDLDGDGYEQTGWVLLYLHVATKDRVQVGQWMTMDDRMGHPSCEGGQATGTHVHLARKYNGQWMLADGPIPFLLSGWRAHAGKEIYQGTMTKDDKTITACTCGNAESLASRPAQ